MVTTNALRVQESLAPLFTEELCMGLFSFQGRVGRMQFWLTSLILYGIVMVLELVGRKSGATAAAMLLLVLLVPIIWASLAVGVKRWHDRDKSGWWSLINLVPIIGTLWALVETGFLKGTSGQNRFGTDPLT
jgi:uncharacterized membrane protein YhaH (DUF805 family)